MRMDQMNMAELPSNMDFLELIDRQEYLWKMYEPTTVEADIPFEQDWWKYAYWMPLIKKEFYLTALSSLDFEKGLQALAIDKYGMDYWFFTTHYGFFIKRMEWMRKQGVTHIGELK